MMLSEEQVVQLEIYLRHAGVRHAALKDELLDHICCLVEADMTMGMSFHQASEKVIETFQENEIKELQHSIYSLQNKKLMMKVSLVGLLLAFFSLSIFDAPAEPPNIAPLKGIFGISAGFGQRLHPVKKAKQMHKGVDFKAPIGTPIHATANGEISQVIEHQTGYGLHIIIRHDEVYESMYAHLGHAQVQEGQQVLQGDVIGTVGITGTTTSPHLHYEVRENGKVVNPESFMKNSKK